MDLRKKYGDNRRKLMTRNKAWFIGPVDPRVWELLGKLESSRYNVIDNLPEGGRLN